VQQAQRYGWAPNCRAWLIATDAWSRPVLASILGRVTKLALYLVLGRAFSATGLIVALWICPVDIMAHVGLYLALLNLATILLFGRYDALIVAAPTERRCIEATHLCIVQAGLTIGLIVGASLITVEADLVSPQLGGLFCAAVVVRAVINLSMAFAIRNGRCEQAYRAMLPQSMIHPFLLVTLVAHSHDPLTAFVLADLIGFFVTAIAVAASQWTGLRASIQARVQLDRLWRLAQDNSSLPLVNLPAILSIFLFTTTPVLLLPTLPNSLQAGTLALLFRILDMPTQITASAISPVLVREVVKRVQQGAHSIEKYLVYLPLLCAALVFSAIAAAGLVLHHSGLIPHWSVALQLLPMVALFQAGVAATAPLTDMVTMTGQQSRLLAINSIALLLAGAVVLLTGRDPTITIAILGMIGFGRAIATGYWLIGDNQRLIGSAVAIRAA
jgi:hypothetical protein